MVRCFLVHTVCPVPALSSGESRLLYCRFFGPDEEAVRTEPPRDRSPEDTRLLRREAAAAVARQVQSAVCLSRAASGRPLVEAVPGEEVLALQEAGGGGVVRLRAGEPFGPECSGVWLALQSVGFTLVCDAHENLLLAQDTLAHLARLALEHLHMLGPGSEVLLRSHRLDALLARLLPHGQLLFLNHRFAQSLEKDVASYMAK